MSEATAPKAIEGTLGFIDERLGSTTFLRRNVKKVFPDHWSFMLGEIALYSFVILLLTGTFLTLWFQPSMTEVVYNGSYTKLQGVKMSQAYASTLGWRSRWSSAKFSQTAIHGRNVVVDSSWKLLASTTCTVSGVEL